MVTIDGPFRRLRIALAVGLLIVAPAMIGCQPQGAGSITVDPDRWQNGEIKLWDGSPVEGGAR
jgi:hypothetical protein